MKKIFFLLVLNCLLYSCSSDDNSVKDIKVPTYDASDLVSFQEGKLWGFFHAKTGNVVIEPQFEDVISFNDYGIAIVKKKGLWGTIAPNGKYIIKPIYKEITEYNYEGLTRVHLNNKYGLVNVLGQIKFNIEYDSIQEFSNHDNIIVVKNKKYGMIDRKLTFLVEPKYDHIDNFVYHYSRVKLGSKIGLINKKGEVLLTPIYDKINEFNLQGFALLELDKKIGIYHLDTKLLEPKFDMVDEIKSYYEYGENNWYFNVSLNGLWGTLGDDFQYIISPRFEQNFEIPRFSYNGKYTKLKIGEKTGVINKQYDWVIKPKYDYINDFEDDPKLLYVTINKKIGVIDINDNIIVPISFDGINYLEERDCFIVHKNNKMTLLNKQGKYLEGYYDRITDLMHNDKYPIYLLEINNRIGIANYELDKITNVEYESYKLIKELTTKGQYYVELSKNNLVTFFNVKTKEFSLKDLFQSRSTRITEDAYVVGAINDKMAVYKITGEKITHFKYKYVYSINISDKSGLMYFNTSSTEYHNPDVMVNYRTGKELVETSHYYSQFSFLNNGNFSLNTRGKTLEFFTNTGVKVFEFKADNIDLSYDTHYLNHGYFHFKQGEYEGLLYNTGKVLIPANRYNSISSFDYNGFAEVTVGNKTGKINKTGKLVNPLQ